MTEQPGCAEVRPLLAELAIDSTTGQERASALDHVAGCLLCRRELDRLAQVVDVVLLLAPPREPPAGFESRLLARRPEIFPEPKTRRPFGKTLAGSHSDELHVTKIRLAARYRVRLVLIAGAAVAVVLAFALGAAVVQRQTADDRALADRYRQTLAIADGRYLRAIRLTGADGARVGTVFLYQGNPSWLLVTVSAAPADGAYQVTVEYRDGPAHHVGVCQLAGGAGTAGYELQVPVSFLRLIRLDGPGGAVLRAQA